MTRFGADPELFELIGLAPGPGDELVQAPGVEPRRYPREPAAYASRPPYPRRPAAATATLTSAGRAAYAGTRHNFPIIWKKKAEELPARSRRRVPGKECLAAGLSRRGDADA